MTDASTRAGTQLASGYPETPSARDRWILERRHKRIDLDPWRPYHFLVEPEAGPDGTLVDAATIFLTNRECPWRCVMCDLYRDTLQETVPDGAIAAQIEYALGRLHLPAPERTHLKLYNAGSFFDHRAIPLAEYPEIARLAAPFPRLVVECHPTLIGKRVLAFRQVFPGQLEIAMGLETAHPEVLRRLNKRMTLEQFRAAAEYIEREGIALRVFILVRPPWLSEAEGLEWAKRSLDFAFECGATVCSLIATRAGNGAMEVLANAGEFSPPTLASLEAALDYGLGLCAGRVFADTWDVETLMQCSDCSQRRIDRLRRMNATQVIEAPIGCRCSL